MIDSRTHAALDLVVALGLAATAIRRGEPRVRWAAAAGAAGQAGLMAITDYDAGIVPRVSYARHRRFEGMGAAALAAAGLAWRSPALLGAGALLAAATALSHSHAHGVPDTLYPPLDVLKPFAPDVWLVDGALGPGVPVRMTVLRLPDGSLLLHSPTSYRIPLRQALERIGPIRHIVAPNSAHWMFAKAWQDAIPEARTFGAPGLGERGPVRRAGLRIDEVLGETPPESWGGAIEQAIVPGGAGFHEVALFHRPSGTLMMTDLVQNLEERKLPWALRPLARLLGNLSPRSRAPGHLRAVVLLRRADAARAARRIVAWSPQRIVVTHGTPIERDAPARLRSSLGWLLG